MTFLSHRTQTISLSIASPHGNSCTAEVPKHSPSGDWSDRLVSMRTINASDFKAHCLAILDEIALTGETIVITKRGKAVARLLPPVPEEGYPQHRLQGSGRIVGDIVAPPLSDEAWEADQTMIEPEGAGPGSTR
jgi:antitoxin (DNA-binding transcriptional repressor) of toxin-antitoxin stability system